LTSFAQNQTSDGPYSCHSACCVDWVVERLMVKQAQRQNIRLLD